MYNDSNKDGSAKVRHVPIHIEPRCENDGQSSNRGQRQQGRGQNMSQERLTSTHNIRDYGQTLPDTSSIDIEYKPSPGFRNQNCPETSANRNHYNQQQYYSSPRSNHPHHQYSDLQQQYHHPHQQQQQEDRHSDDRERHNSSRNISPNSEKLINSPEPIPLPPPSNSNDQNNKATDGKSQDTSFQSKPNATEQGQDSAEQQQQHPYQEQHQPVQQTKDTKVIGIIDSVKMDVMNLVREIVKFDGTTAKCKEYRYIDEMLTRCMLRLDDIQCGDAAELRQQRKATIKLVDQATDILQRKLQINTDIQNLSASMAISTSSSTNV